MKTYDFAIAGAGPAGLAASIKAAELGCSVIVIEKGETAGPEPRGESMPPRDLIDNLMGKDFLPRISNFVSNSRRFHSAGGRKNTLVRVKEPYYFFEWRDFIDPLYKKAVSLGVDFIFNAEVKDVLTENEMACGLAYKSNKNENELTKVYSSFVLGCGGRSCPVASFYRIDTKATACPTVKYRGINKAGLPKWLTNFEGEPDLQFFTILPDSFKSVSGFPPAFAYIFPIDENHFEAGLMLRLSRFEKINGIKMPSNDEIMQAWKEAQRELPHFSDFFKNTETEYEKITSIQNRRFVEDNIKKGAILIGDAIGMVDANGSAGLYYAMAHACSWVEMLSKSLKEENLKDMRSFWTASRIENFYKQQSNWDFYKYIKNSFRLISIFENLLFKIFGTEKKCNRAWSFIGFLLKTAS